MRPSRARTTKATKANKEPAAERTETPKPVDLGVTEEMIESIVNREVTRIKKSDDSLDEKSIRVLEGLSKILDACNERRKNRPEHDPYKETSTEDLAKGFD